MKQVFDFSKATDVKKYFSWLLTELKGCKVKAVYCRYAFLSMGESKYHSTDEPVYILFENGKCLVMDYYFVDRLDLSYREMTKMELEQRKNAPTLDYFNYESTIHDGNTYEPIRQEKVSLPYGKIVAVNLKPVMEEYEVWTERGIEIAQPTKDTFNDVEFMMDNGVSFVIRAGDAMDDGYTFFWADNAVVSTKNLRC